MKMNFHRTGKQFFFITISVMNRTKVSSRLVDEKPRPELLSCGAAVKSLFASLHKSFPCVTASDFTIMPDHVHFLMMVNYSLNSAFRPLWASHRLMDDAEIMWESDGDAIPESLEALNMAISFAKENRGRLTLANRISPAASLKKFSDNFISESALASQKFKSGIPLQSAFPASQGSGAARPRPFH